jgi:hypothetical protein
MGAYMGKELALGSVGDVVPEGFGKELIRGGQVLFAVAEHHTCPGVEGGPGRFGYQSRLAETGLAGDEQYLAPIAGGHALGGVDHRLHFGVTSDDADCGSHSQTGGEGNGGPRVEPSDGLPQNLDRLDGVREALQDQFPK